MKLVVYHYHDNDNDDVARSYSRNFVMQKCPKVPWKSLSHLGRCHLDKVVIFCYNNEDKDDVVTPYLTTLSNNSLWKFLQNPQATNLLKMVGCRCYDNDNVARLD